MVDFKQLVKAGVHFGHQKSRWCPKMAPYIWGLKNKVHLIDVSKTAHQMGVAAKFLQEVTAQGKSILFVGTKKAAQKVIYQAAEKTGMSYVNHRWAGGTLSNWPQVKKSVTKKKHFEDIIAKAETNPFYTKKEINSFQKMDARLEKIIGGICNLAWPIGAIVVIDVEKEHSAIKEAVIMGIPVVAIVDTNGDPSLVDYVIPSNDDAPQALKLIIDYLAEAVNKGKEIAANKVEQAKKEAAEKRELQKKAKEDKTVTVKQAEKAVVKKVETVKKDGNVAPVTPEKIEKKIKTSSSTDETTKK